MQFKNVTVTQKEVVATLTYMVIDSPETVRLEPITTVFLRVMVKKNS